MNKYTTNITAGFCYQWSVSKSIAEYVSNALDAGDEVFELGEDYITITTPNTRVSDKFLLVGVSDKRGDASQRGEFGSGSIQAMAALLSQGVEVVIYNAGVIWIPSFEFSEQWQEEILVINEIKDEGNIDFRVEINNLSPADIDEVEQRCLVLQDREVLFSTPYGDIICGGDGEVFVADMFVCQSSGFKYSYNFNVGVVKLTQDRNAVDNFELQNLTAKMIMATEDKDFIKEAISIKKKDTEHVQYTWNATVPDDVCDSYAEEFIEEHGTGVQVTDSYSEYQEQIELDNEYVYIDNKAQVVAIKNSSTYQDAIENIEIKEKKTVRETLEAVFQEVLYKTERELQADDHYYIENLLDNLLEQSDNWSGDTDYDGLPF